MSAPKPKTLILPIDEMLNASWGHNPEFDEPTPNHVVARAARELRKKMNAYDFAVWKRQRYEERVFRRALRDKLIQVLP